jgi:hypothetical protein
MPRMSAVFSRQLWLLTPSTIRTRTRSPSRGVPGATEAQETASIAINTTSDVFMSNCRRVSMANWTGNPIEF